MTGKYCSGIIINLSFDSFTDNTRGYFTYCAYEM